MTRFKDKELESFVSNNWLHRHGIPMKRKKKLYARKQMAKRLEKEAFFFGETEAVFRIRDRIRYEKALITGADQKFKETYEERERTKKEFCARLMKTARRYGKKVPTTQQILCEQPPAVII